MNTIILTYTLYLLISCGITIWVAQTLFKNGKIFLLDIFQGNKELASSVNNLLLVGFYLVNLGYAVYTLQVTGTINNTREMLEVLSIKIGLLILILGCMHFLNIFLFFNLRKKAMLHKKLTTAEPRLS